MSTSNITPLFALCGKQVAMCSALCSGDSYFEKVRILNFAFWGYPYL